MARWPGDNDNYTNDDHANNDDDGLQECDHRNVGESAGVQADAEEGRESQPQEAAQVLTLSYLFLGFLHVYFSPQAAEGGAHQSAGQEWIRGGEGAQEAEQEVQEAAEQPAGGI